MTPRAGGCLCGNMRCRVLQPPLWVTVCYCTFCQRATGSDRMVEPLFKLESFEFTGGVPRVHSLVSAGSGRDIHLHFRVDCGTRMALTFARWPDRLGVYAGTFDDPGWFEMTPENTKHIFVSKAPAAPWFRRGSGSSSVPRPTTTARRWSRGPTPRRA